MSATLTRLRRIAAIAAAALGLSACQPTPSQPIMFEGRSVQVEELSPDQAVALFKTLPSPTMEEMNGEWSGEMLSFPTLWRRVFWAITSKNPIYPGVWRGKSFHQTGPNDGRGYNTVDAWLRGQVDMWPMLTNVGPSYFDGKPAFRLVYRAFDHYAGDIHMLDEIRRLPDGRYLGIGRTGNNAEDLRMPMPFMLKARIGDYRQDIGTPRAGFDMNEEFKLLEFPASAYAPSAK